MRLMPRKPSSRKPLAARSMAAVISVSAGPPLGGLYLKPPSSGGLCDGVITTPSASPLSRPLLCVRMAREITGIGGSAGLPASGLILAVTRFPSEIQSDHGISAVIPGRAQREPGMTKYGLLRRGVYHRARRRRDPLAPRNDDQYHLIVSAAFF